MSSPAQSREQIRALVGEYLDQKQRETREASLAEAPKRVRTALIVVGLITCAIVWILPSLVKEKVEPPSPERVEASARMTLFLASERVRVYQRTHGRLPASLFEAGVDSTGISYFKSTESTFEMWMTPGSGRVLYRSTMNNAEFLGSTFQTLGTAR